MDISGCNKTDLSEPHRALTCLHFHNDNMYIENRPSKCCHPWWTTIKLGETVNVSFNKATARLFGPCKYLRAPTQNISFAVWNTKNIKLGILLNTKRLQMFFLFKNCTDFLWINRILSKTLFFPCALQCGRQFSEVRSFELYFNVFKYKDFALQMSNQVSQNPNIAYFWASLSKTTQYSEDRRFVCVLKRCRSLLIVYRYSSKYFYDQNLFYIPDKVGLLSIESSILHLS